MDSNDTDLSQTDLKDSKDNKDLKPEDLQRQLIENALGKTKDNPAIEKELIDHFAEDQSIESLYGSYILQNMKKFSFNDFETFKVYFSKLKYAHKRIEEEMDMPIPLYEGSSQYWEQFQKDISSAFWRCIQHYKQGKTEDINKYLFGAFKNEFKSMAKILKSEA